MMEYYVEYECGELVDKMWKDGEQPAPPVIKFRTKHGKTTCRVILPVLSTESADSIKSRSEQALQWAKRCLA